MPFTPSQRFLSASLRLPEHTALTVDGAQYSYRDFALLVRRMAGWVAQARPRRVAILGSRSMESCAGVLAANWLGSAFIPISLKWPEARILEVLRLAEPEALICDSYGTALLTPGLRAGYGGRIWAAEDALGEAHMAPPVAMTAEEIAYIIFTSGSTGAPKGVEIPASAIAAHIDAMQGIYGLTQEDKVAQTSDLSFDVGLSNLFTAWNAGAALCVVPPGQAMAPARMIREQGITFWFSVPSIIHFMQSLKLLTPGAFPSVRASVFAGERLALKAALAWKEAAPNGTVDNAYGPTEGTVVCVYQRLSDAPPYAERQETVALGQAFTGSGIAVVDEGLRILPPGQPGELALTGAQLAAGYFGLKEMTAARFPHIGGERWYLTGDKGVEDEQGRFYHLGRLDHQVKLFGYRIELEDIEAHLRRAARSDKTAVVVIYQDGTPSGLAAFVAESGVAAEEIRAALKRVLPSYMLPGAIHLLAEWPLNANGKIDRKALAAML